jgi:hypothetical protein
MKFQSLFFVAFVFTLFSLSLVLAADTTEPVTAIYMGQEDGGVHNEVSYSPTVYANLWNKEYQTSVTQCQIDWNEGSGWEAVSKGTEETWYSVGYTYSSPGLKRIDYRCRNSDGLWSAGDHQQRDYDTITIEVLPPTVAIYLGEEEGTHNNEINKYTVYASLWNKDLVYDVTECEINWGDGAGFESVGVGSEDNWYYETYTYSTEELKTVSYRCKNSEDVWSAGDAKHTDYDEITLADCESCECENNYSETTCQDDLFVNLSFEWACDGGCVLFNFTNLIEDCSYDDVAYSDYFCADGYNRTRNVTTTYGTCDDDFGCGTDSYVDEDLREYCEFGCVDGVCQDNECTEGETRNPNNYDLCYENNVWNNATYEVCTLNNWVSVFDFTFVEDCSNNTVVYGDWECVPDTDNRTRDVTVYDGFCTSASCYVNETPSSDIEYCALGCSDGICEEQVCEDGEVRNLWGADFCSGLNVLSNVSYEQCFGNEWHPFHVFDQFKEDCSGGDILENQYCVGDDLNEVWSTPICSAGSCDRTNYDLLTICDYGCAEDECLPPTDYPTCSIDYLALPSGENIFNISDFAFNQSGDFNVWGSANANSENFLLTYVTYNRTSLGEVSNYWGNADNQGFWETWRTDQDDDYFLEGEHEVCCRVESKACEGGDTCEIRNYEECSTFCIDSEAPELVIDNRYSSSPWNMTFFQWNWSGLDDGCAGFEGLYNLSVNNSNGSIIWNETNFAGTELMTYGLENNTEYTLTVTTEDGVGNVVVASESIFVLFGDNESSCVENWQCESWSDCDDDTKTRTCNDLNSCGTEFFKPILETDCEDNNNGGGGSGSVTVWSTNGFNETVSPVYQALTLDGRDKTSLAWLWWLLVILLIIGILLLAWWILKVY